MEADRLLWEPATEKKDLSWKALHVLNAARRRPWLCLGDFNEILLEGEKEGGQKRNQACMDRFREALEDCGLADLGFEGDPFTWRNNNHCRENYVKERLDRAVSCGDWTARFPLYKVINGEPRHSDHRPVIVNTDRRLGVGGEKVGICSALRRAGWRRSNVRLSWRMPGALLLM